MSDPRGVTSHHGDVASDTIEVVPNRIQSLLGVQYPVVQAPMTYIARAALAVAVSEAGGLGMLETLTPEGRADLARVRGLTDKPVAANLMIQGWKGTRRSLTCWPKRGSGTCSPRRAIPRCSLRDCTTRA